MKESQQTIRNIRYIIKLGPKWEPCNTPEPTVKSFETKYDTFTACVRVLL